MDVNIVRRCVGPIASYVSLVLIAEVLLSIQALWREVFDVDDRGFTCTTLGLSLLFVLYSTRVSMSRKVNNQHHTFSVLSKVIGRSISHFTLLA